MAPRKTRQTPSSDTEIDNNDTPRDELAELKAQMAELQGRLSSTESALSQERTGRQQAEQRSMSAAERALRSDLKASDTLLESMDSEAQSLEDQIAQLSDEPGHGKEIAGLTRKLATLSARTETETGRKAWLSNEIEKAKGAAAERPEPVAGEVLASGAKLADMTPKVQAWFRAHPRVFTDKPYLDRVIAAANYAANVEGIPVESEEYFAFVDSKVGGTEVVARRAPAAEEELDEGEDLVPETPTADSPYSRPTQRVSSDGDLDYRVERPQAPAAGRGAIAAATPPSRSVPAGAGGQPRRAPLLTSEQREVADSLYGDIKNPADRYLKYSENDKFMSQRKGAGLSMN